MEAEAGWVVIRYVRGGDSAPDGVPLSDWLQQLIDADPAWSHVGP